MLAEIAARAAQRHGERSAFVAAQGWPLSYADLDRVAGEVAIGLVQRGVGRGDVLALVLPSTLDYVAAYVAADRIGAITAGVNPRLSPPERAAAVDLAQPHLVLTTGDLVEGLDPAWPVELVGGRPTGPNDILTALRATDPGPPPPVARDEDAPVAIVFTSGTTGTPKGAVFASRQLAAAVEADWGADRWDGGGPMLASTQFAHVGFMTKLPWYLMSGSTTYLLDRWRASDALRLIAEHRIVSVGGVAPQVALMLRDPDFDSYDLSSVKTIVMGGGPSPPALVAEARARFDAAYSIRYSSTESGGIGTGTAFDADDDEALNTVGGPRPGVEVRVVDEDDRPVPEGEVGELCLRSPTMMSGYWRDPDATEHTMRGGWLHSGDLARIDERGLVRLAGRRKEMFVRGGYNVYPMEVEAVLASHPLVDAVAIVPRPDPVMGEIGVAVVVPRHADRPPTLDELRDHADGRLATYKQPEALRLADDLPLTPMQKVDRRALAEAEREAAPT